MSDRFYKQMSEHYKVAPWELANALRDHNELYYELGRQSMGKSKKVTRKDISEEISAILGQEIELGKLPMLTLEVMVKALKTRNIKPQEVPNGRLKAPFIKAVHDAIGVEVDLSTATVKIMSQFLELIKEKA
ncbi:hypothetical protein CPT_Slocum_056 [Serratia phage Slocum]|nr:hypothetical protein CPT_Slocum_056 [Serratia phage Slocum]URC22476.1 hypothetical protein KAMAJI_00480 [Serratia phage vB_SmaM-Kamaji]